MLMNTKQTNTDRPTNEPINSEQMSHSLLIDVLHKLDIFKSLFSRSQSERFNQTSLTALNVCSHGFY